MKFFMFLLISSFSVQASMLTDYKVKAESLALAVAKNENTKTIATETQNLISISKNIMKNFATKNPGCAEQYKAIFNDMNKMNSMKAKEIHNNYINAEAIPTAPRHCALGRSLMIQPMINLARYKNGFKENEKKNAIEGFDAAAAHSIRAKKFLDNPIK